MTQVIVVAHEPLASALLAVASHAFPDCARTLQALDVPAGEDPLRTEARLRELVDGRDTLILADVFGATPCNVAQRVADGVHVRVVAGVNAPMVWRALCYAHEPVESLAARAHGGAVQGVVPCAGTSPQHPSTKAYRDAAQHAQDQ